MSPIFNLPAQAAAAARAAAQGGTLVRTASISDTTLTLPAKLYGVYRIQHCSLTKLTIQSSGETVVQMAQETVMLSYTKSGWVVLY